MKNLTSENKQLKHMKTKTKKTKVREALFPSHYVVKDRNSKKILNGRQTHYEEALRRAADLGGVVTTKAWALKNC